MAAFWPAMAIKRAECRRGQPSNRTPNREGAGITLVMSLLTVVVMVVGVGGGIEALSALYQTAVYYYAVAGEAPRGFDRDLPRGALGPKRGVSS